MQVMQRCTAMPAWGCLNHLYFHTFPSKPFHNPNKCLIFAAPEPAKPLNDAQPTTNREQNLPSLLEQFCRNIVPTSAESIFLYDSTTTDMYPRPPSE